MTVGCIWVRVSFETSLAVICYILLSAL